MLPTTKLLVTITFRPAGQALLESASRSERFTLITGDLLDTEKVTRAMAGCEFILHLAANADVRFGTDHPRKDLEQNTIATMNVLEAMRVNGVRDIAFSSTGSIYGEASCFPTPENASMPMQTSLYGASKLAAEGFIEAFCEGFGMRAFIFRFVSILGERSAHGHVVDFYKQLRAHPEYLEVLGNGSQRKSYLYVQDCLDAMLLAIESAPGKVNIFNLGLDEYCEVNDSIRWICGHLGLAPNCATVAVIAAGWATTRSSFLTALQSARWAGGQSSTSSRRSFARSSFWNRIRRSHGVAA